MRLRGGVNRLARAMTARTDPTMFKTHCQMHWFFMIHSLSRRGVALVTTAACTASIREEFAVVHPGRDHGRDGLTRADKLPSDTSRTILPGIRSIPRTRHELPTAAEDTIGRHIWDPEATRLCAHDAIPRDWIQLIERERPELWAARYGLGPAECDESIVPLVRFLWCHPRAP